jgi:flagellar biosynthesis protein FlhG
MMFEENSSNDQASRLREIAERACPPRPERRPFVLAISSGKGGVGKSTIALNLGALLAGFGRKVLLFDGDIALGNLDVMSGSVPRQTVAHVLREEIGIEDSLTSLFPNLSLFSSSGGDPVIDVDERGLVGLLDRFTRLEEPFDIIIIDTPAGLNPGIIRYSVFADETYVVTTSEPTAIMDAYAMIKAVSRQKRDHPFSMIINAVQKSREADEAMEKLTNAVGHFLRRGIDRAGTIPFDDHVSQAIKRQTPLVREFPRAAAARSLATIALQLSRGLRDPVRFAAERRSLAAV